MHKLCRKFAPDCSENVPHMYNTANRQQYRTTIRMPGTRIVARIGRHRVKNRNTSRKVRIFDSELSIEDLPGMVDVLFE